MSAERACATPSRATPDFRRPLQWWGGHVAWPMLQLRPGFRNACDTTPASKSRFAAIEDLGWNRQLSSSHILARRRHDPQRPHHLHLHTYYSSPGPSQPLGSLLLLPAQREYVVITTTPTQSLDSILSSSTKHVQPRQSPWSSRKLSATSTTQRRIRTTAATTTAAASARLRS